MRSAACLTLVLSTFATLPMMPAHAVELTVFSPGALRTTMSEVAPLFESASSNKLTIRFGSTRQLHKRLQRGEPADRAGLGILNSEISGFSA